MSWKTKQRLQNILEGEECYIKKEWGGKISVAIVYPNSYEIGMGNLAIHSLYRDINKRDDFLCERFFLQPSGTELVSMESQRYLNEFDIVAFSISFENDFLNIIPILESGKIVPWKERRQPEKPIMIAGGAAPSLNPRPLSKIFDAIYLGEVEDNLDGILNIMACDQGKEEIISQLKTVSKTSAHTKDLNSYKTETTIYSSTAQFSEMHLIEIMRGCSMPCRFCCTPKLYNPPRYRSFDVIKEMIDNGSKFRRRFGLIGSELGNHPEFEKIIDYIHKRGFSFSPSSLRVDAITREISQKIAQSGIKSISLGIEAGSEEMRKKLGKKISEEKILSSVEHLKEAGIKRLRLYFMIGLPEETERDLKDIVAISQKVVARFKGKVELTITPFIPKPLTTWADKEFAGTDYLTQAQRMLRPLLRKERDITARFEPVEEAEKEYLLSNGDEETLLTLDRS